MGKQVRVGEQVGVDKQVSMGKQVRVGKHRDAKVAEGVSAIAHGQRCSCLGGKGCHCMHLAYAGKHCMFYRYYYCLVLLETGSMTPMHAHV